MNNYEKQYLLNQLKNAIRCSGLRQQDIALKLNIDQARVSRLVSGRFVHWSGDIKRLCDMFKVAPREEGIDASKDSLLMSTLNKNWDGSPEHARLIAKLIDDVCAIHEHNAHLS